MSGSDRINRLGTPGHLAFWGHLPDGEVMEGQRDILFASGFGSKALEHPGLSLPLSAHPG